MFRAEHSNVVPVVGAPTGLHYVPVPDTVAGCGLSDPLSVIFIVADRDPLALGVNLTVTVQ
jgi:hypothetical protein